MREWIRSRFAAETRFAATDPHAIEGGWRLHRRPTLRRALLAAALGGLAGLAGAGSAPPRKRSG